MKARSYVGLFWLLALVGAGLDLGSKYFVFHWLYNNGQGDQRELVPGAFRLLAQFSGERETGSQFAARLRNWGGEVQPQVNHGALFGLGNRHQFGANVLFAVISILAAAAIIFWSTRPATGRDGFLCAALGLILAGTLGNLYDRLVFGGVRDFLHFYWIEWPVFNIADCCLVAGAALLLLQAFVNRPAPETTENVAVALASNPSHHDP